SALWANGADVTRYWVNLHDYNISFIRRNEHANILEVPQVNSLLSDIITNFPDALPPFISTTQPVYSGLTPRLHFVLHSPLTLGFIDSNGNYAGSTATSTVLNIPGVTYERLGEVQWLSIPKGLTGLLVLKGTGDGHFTLDGSDVDGNDVLSTTTF